MEKLIKKVLDKYNIANPAATNAQIAKAIVSHIRKDGGWYLNLNTHGPTK